MSQEYVKKGFKNQDEYNDYLDSNHLIICDGCENEVKESEVQEFYNKLEETFDQICRVCAAFEDRD